MFSVPLLQRPYAWECDEWDNFWIDILDCINSNSIQGQLMHNSNFNELKFQDNHFMGLFIFVQDGVTKKVFDGQQRISTILIFLSIIRQLLNQSNEEFAKELSKTIFRNYLCFTDDEAKKTGDRLEMGFFDKNFFSSFILSEETDLEKIKTDMNSFSASRKIKSYEKIRDCFFYLLGKVSDHIEGKSDIEKVKLLKILYYTLKDGLDFVQITIDSEEKAAVVFETVNSRAEPLSEADLIKVYVLEGLGPDDIEDNFEKWNKIIENVSEVRIVDYIKDNFISRHPLQPDDSVKHGLYKIVKKRVTSSLLQSYFDSLYNESFHYSEILFPNEINNDPNDELKRIYSDIATLKIQRINPLILAGLSVYTELSDKFSFLKLVESFVFRYKIIVNHSPDQLLKIVNYLSVKVRNSADYTLDNLKSEMLEDRHKINDSKIDLYLTGFGKNAKKPLIRFILSKIENEIRRSKGCVPIIYGRRLSIEHILPENVRTEDLSKFGVTREDHEELYWRLGNLLLVKIKTNNTLEQKIISEKLEILQRVTDFEMVKEFYNHNNAKTSWGKTEIMSGQHHVNSLMKAIWPL